MSFQNSDSIKQAVYDELRNILSAESSLRTAAEERLNQLKFTDGYGVYLAEFTMNQTFDLGLRQLSAVMLKKYIEVHWSNGEESQTCDQAKKMIKSILPNGLYDPNSKIRTSVAYTISTIASHDWPNNWMELFDIIVKCLGGNENSVHGAMQVLVEFTYDLQNQISTVGPIILAEVYRIFAAEANYSVKTRSCAVDIFKSLLKSIATYVETREEQVAILSPVLDNFMQKMMISLSLPNGSNSSFQLKTSILKVFCYLLNYMPKFIQPHINSILTPVWQLLTQTADVYGRVVINETIENPFPNSDDDEIENLTTMILQMFEFIHGLIESKKFKQLIKNVMVDLIYIVIVYMQITEEQIEDWTSDPGKFVQDEEEQNVDYSVRVSAQDVLIIIGQEVDKVLPALQEALSRHCCVADAEKNANNPHWWKIHEACMLAVGCFDYLIESEKEDSKFNLSEYLNMSKNLMSVSDYPFLSGRCLCLMSQFAGCSIYNPQLLRELLDLTVVSLSEDKPIVTRISAVKSVQLFCENLKKSPPEKREVLLSKMGTFYDGVFALLGQGKYNLLNLLLETFHSIISFDDHFTASIQNKIIPLTIGIFLKHPEDRYTLELVLDLLKILSQNTFCLGTLQEKILPTLVSILSLEKEQVNTSFQDRSLDVLETIVRNCKPPLSDALMETAFPAIVQCILKTDDASVMQRGGKCLRAFVHVAPDQVCNFRNREGLNYIMQVATMLLNPMNSEATSAGELVITLISKAGNYLGENIYLLLKAVISKMQMVNDWDAVTNLILIFAHLFLTQMEAILNFLTTVPGPTGEPAITYIFSNWLSRHQSFYGFYVRKVSVMALSKVFEYGVTSKDNRLTTVNMKVIITNPNVKAKTRSQYMNAQQCVAIPILVRILQILISELADMKELQQAGLEEEDDTDEESANDSFEQPKEQLGFNACNSDEDDEVNDDTLLKEILDDPILQSDFDLTKFLQNFSRDDTFREFLVHLNDAEKEVLRSIEVNV